MTELSVVIPVHNEADNILPLLAETAAALDGHFQYEVLVVDDGSTDGTAGQLREAARRFPRLRVIRHVRQSGQSTALATGVRMARGDLIATLDGDGQNDPADIPALADVLRGGRSDGLALVAGHRVTRHDSALQRFSSRVANGVRSRLLHDETPDTGCGLKVFRRAAFLDLPYFDHMHRFLPALMLRHGHLVRSVPVGHRPRTSGRSHYGVHNRLWVGLVDLGGVLWLRRRTRLTEAVEVTLDPGEVPNS
ncbi:MAG TPA: glycosyltransferase family 2 protein [Gemmatimonadales bacterium]|nr:glycosyltransferase family 2 protein [Gemmatimonadales bacterium]